MVTNTNVLDAAYHTIHDYPGGVHAMAQRLGDVSPNVLNKQADPSVDTHVLSLKRSVKIQAISNDYRILKAMAFELHHVAIPLPDVPDLGDMGIMDSSLWVSRKVTGIFSEFQDGYSDGDIDNAEMLRIEAAINDAHASIEAWGAHVRMIHNARKREL